MRYEASNMNDQDRILGVTIDGVALDLTEVEWIDTNGAIGVFRSGKRHTLQG